MKITINAVSITLLLAVITGCATQPELYWGWSCGGDPRSGEWQCTQKLMRDGQPVNPLAIDPDQIPPLPAALEKNAPPSAPSDTAAVDDTASVDLAVNQDQPVLQTPASSDGWKKQLPALNGSLDAGVEAEPTAATNRIPPKAAVQPHSYPDGPPRAETYQSAIAADAKSSSPAANKTEKKVRIKTQAKTQEKIQNSARIKTVSASGYTIQLAALTSTAEVKGFIEENQLAGEALQQHYIRSRGRNWLVLTYGQFASHGQAQSEAQALSDKYPQLEGWVRSLRSLQKAAVTAR